MPERTIAGLCREMGRLLQLRRQELPLSVAEVTRRGGPRSTKTVKKLERGAIRDLDELDAYAQVLDVNLFDVVCAACSEGRLSPKETRLLRAYQAMEETAQRSLEMTADAYLAQFPKRRYGNGNSVPRKKNHADDRGVLRPRPWRRRRPA